MSSSPSLCFQHRIIDLEPPSDPHIKAAGDIDGDGNLDVVVASSDGGPLVWYRNPDWDKETVNGFVTACHEVMTCGEYEEAKEKENV